MRPQDRHLTSKVVDQQGVGVKIIGEQAVNFPHGLIGRKTGAQKIDA